MPGEELVSLQHQLWLSFGQREPEVENTKVSLKIRQIWRDTEDSHPAFKLAQQGALSTHDDDEGSTFSPDSYFQLHFMGDRANSQFFLLCATMVHHTQARHKCRRSEPKKQDHIHEHMKHATENRQVHASTAKQEKINYLH